MKKVVLGLALATMIISCQNKETKVVKETTETVEAAPPADTVVTKTETVVDTVKVK